MRNIDFHCHSTFSDGTLEPYQLVAAAASAGLAGLALTDHDTVEGAGPFLEAARRKGFLALAGTELSLEYKGITHLLGLDVAPESSRPLDLGFLQKCRAERNESLHRALESLGRPVDRQRVAELAGEGQTGKPHFALAMVERGYVSSRQEAFELYLGLGRPAYVRKRRLSPPEALGLMLGAGWCPVLAHPVTLRIPIEEYPETLKRWKGWGLVGLEVYHPDHHPLLSAFFRELADRIGLVPTCGSDFHGANKEVPLTWVRDNSTLTAAVLDRLREGLRAALSRDGGVPAA
ncbi:MAG: PHP domain-containing protein [Deltaproteobacteria bacterium]|jgi:predicted metal-dependent phosphoesterase TrpH|nr:PHP domain-containing protein [Deltaproteobacteria bacterium]